MKMKLKDQLKQQSDIEVPYNVWRMFGSKNQNGVITLAGGQASFGEDYGTLPELQAAIEWYADQLGGKITWEKEATKERG
jgi:hypothetical protein